jgi:predicted ATPase
MHMTVCLYASLPEAEQVYIQRSLVDVCYAVRLLSYLMDAERETFSLANMFCRRVLFVKRLTQRQAHSTLLAITSESLVPYATSHA